MMEYIINNAQWIFSGVGVAFVVGLIGFLKKKRNCQKQEIKGDVVIQVNSSKELSEQSNGTMNLLITKIADATGVWYEPTRIRRKARAENDAAFLTALTQFKISELQKRAIVRFSKEEVLKQANIEDVIERSFTDLSETAEPNKIDNDWLLNFLDKVKYVSSEQMRAVWAKILAGESNVQGSFSKTTLRILSEMSRSDAEVFQNLSRFVMEIDGFISLFVDDYEKEFYKKYDITFDNLNQLERLGLVSMNSMWGYHRSQIPHCINVSYVNRRVKLYFKKEKDNLLDSGKVILSQSGEELMKICNPLYDDEVFKYFIHVWEQNENVEKVVVEN